MIPRLEDIIDKAEDIIKETTGKRISCSDRHEQHGPRKA